MISSPVPLRSGWFFVLMIVLTFCAVCLIGELFARFAVPDYKKFRPPPFLPILDYTVLFRHDEKLGWFPRAGVDQDFTSKLTVRVTSNAEGFRDIPHPPGSRRPRWFFVGDSFVWGYNVEAAARFTDILRPRFPEAEIYNCGVSGYGTDQAYLLYLEKIRVLHPTLIVLVFGGNDRADNSKTVTAGGYAKPRFAVRAGSLVLQNVPVPDLNPGGRRIPWYRPHLFDALLYRWDRLRNRFEADPSEAIVGRFFSEVKESAGRFAVVIKDRDADMKAFCEKIGCPVFELCDALDEAVRKAPVVFPAALEGHWTPWGHRAVAEALGPFLKKAVKSFR